MRSNRPVVRFVSKPTAVLILLRERTFVSTVYTFRIRKLWQAKPCFGQRRLVGENQKEERNGRADAGWARAANEGDEEERNYDKGCWQTVTGTTLSATRFCAYHSPPVHHRRHRCHPRPIWSDLNLLDPILYSRFVYLPPSSSISDLSSFPSFHDARFPVAVLLIFTASTDTFEREERLRFGE